MEQLPILTRRETIQFIEIHRKIEKILDFVIQNHPSPAIRAYRLIDSIVFESGSKTVVCRLVMVHKGTTFEDYIEFSLEELESPMGLINKLRIEAKRREMNEKASQKMGI